MAEGNSICFPLYLMKEEVEKLIEGRPIDREREQEK